MNSFHHQHNVFMPEILARQQYETRKSFRFMRIEVCPHIVN